MRRGARSRAGLAVLLVSAPAWLLLLTRPDLLAGHAHAGPSLAAGWALMVVAMMAPLLVAPARHVLERSFRRRRARSLLLFVAGHGAVWMAAGAVLLAAVLALRSVLPPAPTLAIMGLLAVAWHASPARQRCVNRSHHHPELAAFGTAADRDALRFGATHGAWCVGSCWALMLLPLALPQGHLVAMAVVTLLLVSERLEEPRPPAWRLRVPTKLLRIAVAQARMRFPAAPASVPRRRGNP